MQIERKPDDQGLLPELRVTDNLDEPLERPEKGEQKIEAPSLILPIRPLEPQKQQQDILLQDGFAQTFTWYQDTAADADNFQTSNYIAFFPCELVAVSWRYARASSTGSTGFYIERIGTTSSSGETITGGASTICSTTATADVTYSKNKKQHFNEIYSYFLKDDALRIRSFGVLTNLKDLVVTLHFKYLGRGETRHG